MRGCQEPRIRIEPERMSTDGKGAAMLMQEYGLTLDPWQRLVLDCWLGKDGTGDYCVTSAGLSVPRQNGKNVIIEAREFYGLAVNGERILHTAHQARTAKKAFRRLVAMFTDKAHPEILALVKQIRYGIGEECIELLNGGIIEFTSRSRQAARGYDGISLVVFDEAQELTDDQSEAIVATLSASMTGTRQMIYSGTPPYIGCAGEVFRRYRQACITAAGEGAVGRSSWHEWSVPGEGIEEIIVTDKKLWYECNPALGYRLTEEFTAEELKTLSPDGFARERLGWWSKTVSETADHAIDEASWDACSSILLKPEGKTAYGVKFSIDGSEVVLCGAVIPKKGPARISLIERRSTGQGITWLAEWLNARHNKAACVVIDGRNGTDLLVDKIHDSWRMRGSIIKPSSADVIAAATMLVNEINEQTVTWYDKQLGLRESAVSAVKRTIGRGWGFGGPDSAPIEAAALALWGCRTSKRDPSKKMRIG